VSGPSGRIGSVILIPLDAAIITEDNIEVAIPIDIRHFDLKTR